MIEGPMARPSAATMPMDAAGPEGADEEPDTAPMHPVEEAAPPRFTLVMRDARTTL